MSKPDQTETRVVVEFEHEGKLRHLLCTDQNMVDRQIASLVRMGIIKYPEDAILSPQRRYVTEWEDG